MWCRRTTDPWRIAPDIYQTSGRCNEADFWAGFWTEATRKRGWFDGYNPLFDVQWGSESSEAEYSDVSDSRKSGWEHDRRLRRSGEGQYVIELLWRGNRFFWIYSGQESLSWIIHTPQRRRDAKKKKVRSEEDEKAEKKLVLFCFLLSAFPCVFASLRWYLWIIQVISRVTIYREVISQSMRRRRFKRQNQTMSLSCPGIWKMKLWSKWPISGNGAASLLCQFRKYACFKHKEYG